MAAPFSQPGWQTRDDVVYLASYNVRFERMNRRMTSKQLLLWDLDGTLTDPMVGITSAVQHALRAFQIDPPDRQALTPFIGPPLQESFQRFYGFSEEQARKAVAAYREYFADTGLYENEVYPGIPELLADLKDAGKTLALATSKPAVFAERIL